MQKNMARLVTKTWSATAGLFNVIIRQQLLEEGSRGNTSTRCSLSSPVFLEQIPGDRDCFEIIGLCVCPFWK